MVFKKNEKRDTICIIKQPQKAKTGEKERCPFAPTVADISVKSAKICTIVVIRRDNRHFD